LGAEPVLIWASGAAGAPWAPWATEGRIAAWGELTVRREVWWWRLLALLVLRAILTGLRLLYLWQARVLAIGLDWAEARIAG
jgi:hypothetical protein